MTITPTRSRHPALAALLNLTGQLVLLTAIPLALWKLSATPIPKRMPSWEEIQFDWRGIEALTLATRPAHPDRDGRPAVDRLGLVRALDRHRAYLDPATPAPHDRARRARRNHPCTGVPRPEPRRPGHPPSHTRAQRQRGHRPRQPIPVHPASTSTRTQTAGTAGTGTSSNPETTSGTSPSTTTTKARTGTKSTTPTRAPNNPTAAACRTRT